VVQKPSCLLACLLGRQQLPEQSCVSTIYSRGPTRACGREPLPRADAIESIDRTDDLCRIDLDAGMRPRTAAKT
jgi:hypothetical protein